jgi:hypothetical protein
VSKGSLFAWIFRGAVIVGALAMPVAGDVAKVGRLEAKDLDESSGLVASRRHRDILYTHNDSGGAPVIFAIRPTGALVKQFRVPAKHTDWEDISIDDAGRLYIANTGNNNVHRDAVEVHRLAEPDLGDRALTRKSKAKKKDTRAAESRLRVEHTWRLRFPGEPFNCESLVVLDKFGYLISKAERDGDRAAMYRFPLDDNATEVTLEKVTDLPIHRRATGASLSPDAQRLAIVTDGELCLFDIAGDPANAGRAQPKRVPLPAKKIESVAFTPDGILMTAESREVYRYAEPTPEPK